MDNKGRDVALHRYVLVREAADPSLTPAQRGELVRALASVEHLGPEGNYVKVSRPTLDRWIRAWRAGGFDALMPKVRKGVPVVPRELLDLAEDLKREAPKRTAVQIAEIVRAARGSAPSARTIQRHFAMLGLNRTPDGRPPKAFGRFEALAPNDLWTGDALHGPVVGAAKTYLFAYIDDHSRLLPGYRWGYAEDTLRLEAALRAGLAARGVPRAMYVDNGSAYSSRWLERACGVLGVRLVHSKPGEPAGRGKIERVFATVRQEFLVEIDQRGVAGIAELNSLFAAWVETIYHRRVHSETKQAPLERFMAAGTPTLPTPADLHAAFLWCEWRTVTKTATVNLFANSYEVDQALVGAKVELLFDPFDMASIRVRYRGREMGPAVPLVIGRNVHPKAKPDPTPPPKPQTGIDYLKMIEAQHREETRRRISYSGLPEELSDESPKTGNDQGANNDQAHNDEASEEDRP
jgi:putative transposase